MVIDQMAWLLLWLGCLVPCSYLGFGGFEVIVSDLIGLCLFGVRDFCFFSVVVGGEKWQCWLRNTHFVYCIWDHVEGEGKDICFFSFPACGWS